MFGRLRLLYLVATLLVMGASGAAMGQESVAPGDVATPESTAPEVVLANFTTAISDREPVDSISFLSNDKRIVYFFTDLRNLTGTVIQHVWSYNGQQMGTVRFDVKGDRWRVWSSKELLPAWLGEWTVNVTNDRGEVMVSESFTYQAGP